MEIWMEISRDKYQLPVRVAESIEELAEMCGNKPITIRASISKAKVGRLKEKYVKVIIDEEED